MALLILLALILVFGGTVALLIIWQVRRNVREKKNYERALKLVPLFIHLPPMSEDIEANGRDTRDIVDENISKAQIIYNIIASTMQKGFKSRLYGQRHFAFEVVGSQGLVYFYAMVPIVLVDVVKQAIISAYSGAQVEEVSEHNIFNQVGRLTGITGGEFVLKKPFAYPIATYQDIKRDTMQAVLNALSTLEKEDGVSIQILLRPADPKWQHEASALASNKRKGKGNKSVFKNITSLGQQFFMALVKPPEGGDGKKDDRPELSSLEQSVLDSIDDKTRYQGYETLIRVIVSSNISQRAQAILANIVAAFSLFDAPGKNGFKYVPAEHPDTLVNNYILRLFPQHNHKMILNAVELATLFHFPDQRNIPTSQLKRQESKQVDAPRNMSAEGLLLGYNIFRGVKKPIHLALQDRQRHMYAVGQTGTGKSTFLENLALQDMLNGDGFAFVDPHGDTAERLLSMVPRERTEDVIYFSPADITHPMGLNLFEFHTADQKDFIIQEVLNMLYKLYDPQHQGIMGPRYEDMFRNAALAVMADPNGGTFIEIPLLFRDPQFLKQKLQHVKDETVLGFWQKQFPSMQRSNEAGDVIAWFTSKFGAFLSNEMMRNIIGQTKSAFNLREVMDNKKILFVNLSKGRTGDLNSKLLGMIFVMKFQAAAMSRANVPEGERKDFALYVDEFQNFSTDSFATILSEARKYHLNLIVANQFTTQLSEEIRDAVFGNVGTTVGFRVGDRDAESLHRYFRPAFDETDLIRMPNYNAAVRTMVGGVPTLPFSMATLPPLGNPNAKLAEALKQLSAAKYGRPKADVEAEIFERMKTKYEPPKSPFGSAPAWGAVPPRPYENTNSPFGGPAPQPVAPNKAGSSFLDDWLAKRQPSQGTYPVPGASNQNQNPNMNPSATAGTVAVPRDNVPAIDRISSVNGNRMEDVPGSGGVLAPMPASAPSTLSEPQQINPIQKAASPTSEEPRPIQEDAGEPPANTITGKDDNAIYIDKDGTLSTNDVKQL